MDRHLNEVGVRLLPFANQDQAFMVPAAVGRTEPETTDAADSMNVGFRRGRGELLSSRALRTVILGFLYQW